MVRKIDNLLAVAMLLTLALLIIAGYKGLKEEREMHYAHLKGHPVIIADITVNLTGTPKQEHCQTCHPEGSNFVTGPNPVHLSTPHPDIRPHSIYALGCTGCHLGEGMAGDLKISHGTMNGGAQKVLARADLQASCYKCHELKPLKGAEKAWRGFGLFGETACDTCHSTGEVKNASYGPDLGDAGAFLSLDQLQKSIENPKADLESSIMPKFALSPEEIKAVSYFLKSRVREPFFETPMIRTAKAMARERSEERATPERIVSGIDLLKEKRCLACHKFGESDGQVAPDLSFTAFMRQEDYIKNFLYSPGREIPGAIMPRVPMTGNEKKRVIDILRQKQVVHFHGGDSAKNIYMMVCQRCHAAEGDGFGIIEPNLANFPRPFLKNAAFFQSIPDKRIVQSVERGIPGTSMPPYGEILGKKPVNAMIDLLFQAFIRTERLNKRIVGPPAKPAALPSPGKNMATFKKECYRCHGIEGTGKGPEYLKYMPRPRNLTNRPYFGSLSDERIATALSGGIPGTAMPSFGDRLLPESIWGLTGTVRELSGTKGGT